MKKILATAAVLSIATVAFAQDATIDIQINYVETVSIGGVDHDVYEAVQSGENPWTNTDLTATATGTTFFYAGAPFGAPGAAPNSGFFGFDPTLEYNTFGAGPLQWPNNPTGATAASSNPGSIWNATEISAGWFDTNALGEPAGSWVVARMTVERTENYTLSGFLRGFSNQSGGVGSDFPFEIVVPEPSTLALLAIGAVAGLIRRR